MIKPPSWLTESQDRFVSDWDHYVGSLYSNKMNRAASSHGSIFEHEQNSPEPTP